MQRNTKLRVAIDCRIRDSQQGVGTAVLALANALSASKPVNQEYTFIVCEDMRDWLAPYIYGPCRLVSIPGSTHFRSGLWRLLFSQLKRVVQIAPLQPIWVKVRGEMTPVPISDGYVESQRFDVVHFPTQAAYLTEIPSIYQPWDLQHLHYPQFFSETEFVLRERYYPAFCNQARRVCVQASWTKEDIIKNYDIASEKIVVIPWGSVLNAYQAPSEDGEQKTVEKYSLPGHFFFYPAITWPHKNHEVIIRALHILKREHRTPDVYFTGASTQFRSTLDQIAKELGVFEQLHYLGFVTPEELQVIFHAATAMVFPSKFEGFGLPILEAFDARLPVLSSNATTLPEVAQNAALYFDPDNPLELASLMKKMLDDPHSRQDLIDKGALVLSRRSIKDTVAHFQVLYESTAASLSDDNRRFDAV
jgi:glycosyltransferase involved in cell wall biosynthesis